MRSLLLLLGWGLVCLAVIFVAEQPRLGAKPAAPPAAAAKDAQPQATQDEAAIRQLISAFVKAYNAADAKTIAGQFIIGGEVVGSDGARAQGRAAIEDLFGGIFKQHPKTEIELEIESIRLLGPSLATEEGLSTVRYEPDGPTESGRYLIAYVKQDGRWQTASARELPDNGSADSSSLDELDWLVGSWVDESPEALVKTSYHWNESHRFLVGEFAVHIAGRPAMSGTHRIGWDPLAGQIRSWVFDSEGGFGEALWTASPTDPDSDKVDRWVVKMSGVTHDGHVGSATNVYTRLGDDRYSFESRDRVVGGAPGMDIPEFVVAREAPRPEE